MKNIPIEQEQTHGFHIVRPQGWLTVVELFSLRKVLEDLEKKKELFIALDLRKVDRIDSSALGLIRNYSRMLAEKSGMFCLIGPKPEVREVIRVANLEKDIPMVSDMEEFEKNFKI